jgi:hypothetical protein
MDKKVYLAPAQEVIKINNSHALLAGSPGGGINNDFSAPTTDTPSTDQPTEW